MTDNQLAQRPQTGMDRVKTYMLSPEVKERFTDMMGADAIYYLNQVLILVANSKDLQECTPQSILIAAMRAASLKLSVDPSQGQAWIIPYKDNNSGTVIATYQTGYKGVYELALRTNCYRFINVFEVFEGEWLEENRMTGLSFLRGKRTGDKILGYCLYFKLLNGFEKTFYMTIEEIESHGKHYSKAYSFKNSKWNDPYERPKMMRKTVMVNGLRRYGRFNAGDKETLETIEQEQGWANYERLPEENEVTVLPPAEKKPEAELMGDLGFAPDAEVIPAAAAPAPAARKSLSANWPADAKVSYETACTIKNSDGKPYTEVDPKSLAFVFNDAVKKLRTNGLSENDRVELELKRDTIQALIKANAGTAS